MRYPFALLCALAGLACTGPRVEQAPPDAAAAGDCVRFRTFALVPRNGAAAATEWSPNDDADSIRVDLAGVPASARVDARIDVGVRRVDAADTGAVPPLAYRAWSHVSGPASELRGTNAERVLAVLHPSAFTAPGSALHLANQEAPLELRVRVTVNGRECTRQLRLLPAV